MAGQGVKYEAMMVPIAAPLETGTRAAALHSEIHLHNKEPSSIYTHQHQLETRGALSPGSEYPQLSLFGSCTEVGLKTSGKQGSSH